MSSSCRFCCYKEVRKPIKNKIDKSGDIQLVFFDMDGVLTDTISSWKHIHDAFNTSNERSVNKYLKGKIDDLEFIRLDVSLWVENGKLTKISNLKKILYQIPLIKGAKQLISFLKKHDVKVVIISAGLDILANRVAEELDIDYVVANGVKTDRTGRLTGDGILRVKLMYKDENVINIAKEFDIPLENCMAIGNSCFDVPMFETCGIGIAFNPDDDCVRDAADIVVEGKDLKKLKEVLEAIIQP